MAIELKGQRYKNASGRETYGIYDAEPNFLENLAAILKSRFGFRQQGKTVAAVDVVYMDFTNGTITLVLGWDNWSGCFVFALEPEGDEYVIGVGDYMETLLKAS